MLALEARGLLTRLSRVRPFALLEPMVPAAGLLPSTQAATERYLVSGRRELRDMVILFLDWLAVSRSSAATTAEAQRRYAILRLKFNTVLTQFDLFSDAVSQRSEHDTGVWLSGLDIVAHDALALKAARHSLVLLSLAGLPIALVIVIGVVIAAFAAIAILVFCWSEPDKGVSP